MCPTLTVNKMLEALWCVQGNTVSAGFEIFKALNLCSNCYAWTSSCALFVNALQKEVVDPGTEYEKQLAWHMLLCSTFYTPFGFQVLDFKHKEKYWHTVNQRKSRLSSFTEQVESYKRE